MQQLREYQADTLDHKLPEAFKKGHKRVCLYGACGSGKSTMIAELCRRSVSKGGNVTVTAHRRRLIKQLAERMKAFGIRYSVEMATLPDEPWAVQDSFAEVVIGSKDTMLTRKKDISVRKTRLWIPDECVTGDTLVETESGRIRIDSIVPGQAVNVLSHDGTAASYRPVTAFFRKGKRATLTIQTASGKSIRCTHDHLLFTQRGWVSARSVLVSDSLLCADADVASRPASAGGEGQEFISLATKDTPRRNERSQNGERCTRRLSTGDLCANAGVGSCASLTTQLLKVSLRTVGARNTDVFAVGTTKESPTGTSASPDWKGKQYWEPCLAIRVLDTHTDSARLRDCLSIMAGSRRNGHVTRRTFFPGLTPASKKQRMRDLETPSFGCIPLACRASFPFTTLSSRVERNGLPAFGWTPSETLGWRGGCATTEVLPGTASISTPKASQKKTSVSQQNGSRTGTGQLASISRKGNTSCWRQGAMPEDQSSNPSSVSCLPAWTTNFDPVVSCQDGPSEEVFDITVDGTHCFFANGILAHNCHTIAGRGYQELGDAIGAEFVIGPTATPCLSDGSGFGPKLFTELVISTTVEWLIANKYLVPVDPYAPVGAARRRREGLKQGVAGDPVKQWIDYAEGMRTVTFCRTLEECRAVRTMFVQAMVPAEHIDSESDDATRDDAIRRLQSGELKVLVCTPGLLGVGVDIPELECVQTLVKNISPIPFWQSIGRGQRITAGKTRAVLLDHAAAVFEHGLPNFSPAWKLGTDDSVQFRQLRRMSEKAEMKPVVCPACGYISTGGRCPKCNTLTVNRPGKRVVTDRENLAEVKEVEPIEKTQVEWRRILFMSANKGWNCLKAFVVFRGKFGKWPHDCGVEPPPSWDDRTKKVAEVWPWLVKGNV